MEKLKLKKLKIKNKKINRSVGVKVLRLLILSRHINLKAIINYLFL